MKCQVAQDEFSEVLGCASYELNLAGRLDISVLLKEECVLPLLKHRGFLLPPDSIIRRTWYVYE